MNNDKNNKTTTRLENITPREDINFKDIFSENVKPSIFRHHKTKKSKNFLGQKRKIFYERKSLFELTKEFMEYICNSECKVIDLNDLAETLGIHKRRLYDITNILGGKLIYFNKRI